MSISKLRGTQLLIKVGNGDGPPETFAQPCLINTKRGFKLTVSNNKEITPDCDNPDDPAWQETFKDMLGVSIDGAGKLNKTDVGAMFAWLTSKTPKNIQVWVGDYGHFDGAFHLTNFEITGDRGGSAESTISLESTGAVTWTAA
jgi:predicted secreted protein